MSENISSPPPPPPNMMIIGFSVAMVIILCICCYCCFFMGGSSPSPAPYGYSGPSGPSVPSGPSGPSPNPVSGANISSPSPAPMAPVPAPAPLPTDPRMVVWSTGQSIQSSPIDSQTATTTIATQPTGYSGTPSYTMSMDINITNIATTNFRNILSHSPIIQSGDSSSAQWRRPAVFVMPNSTAIHLVHSDTNNGNTNIVTTSKPALGKYFNLTWTVSNGTLNAYINGVLDTTGTIKSTFTWPNPDIPWLWMHNNYKGNINGPITVANVYFWNSPLTAAQIAQLAVPATPITGASTTSYYEPEPYRLSS